VPGLPDSGMTLYALERIDDAASLTRSLLLPVRARQWLKLSVVVAFVGLGSGGGGVENLVSNVPSAASAGTVPGVNIELGSVTLPENVLGVVAVVIATVILLGLVFAAVGAVMEFVFVTALRDREVSIRSTARSHLRQGLGLFGFRLLLGATVAVFVGTAALGLFWNEVTTVLDGGELALDPASVALRAAVVGLVGFVVGVPVALVHGLTTEFVVPVMLETDRGVLGGWTRFWQALRNDFAQFGAYLLVGFALRVVTAIAAGIVLGLLAVLALIPFAVVAFVVGIGALAGGSAATTTVVVLVLLGLAYLTVVVALAGIVYVPVRAFHRYHALLVLGDVDPEVDVIGAIRPPLSA